MRSVACHIFLAIVAVCMIAPARAEEPVRAVATFSILGDMVRVVGGDRLDLTVLVGPDGDAHTFEPSPSDARALAEAKIVFVNGLGFEGWLERLLKASGTRAKIVVASTGVTPLMLPEDPTHADDHGEGTKHDHGGEDPHAWHDLANAKIYVANIAQGLSAVDPAHASIYAANARSYRSEIDTLEAEAQTMMELIPAERRTIVTNHDAFGYLGQAYGLKFLAPVGLSTQDEPSAQDMARLIDQIRREKISAVFVENISDARLIDQIKRETGAVVGGTLYSDALSKADGPAATFLEMYRVNIETINAGLTP